MIKAVQQAVQRRAFEAKVGSRWFRLAYVTTIGLGKPQISSKQPYPGSPDGASPDNPGNSCWTALVRESAWRSSNWR